MKKKIKVVEQELTIIASTVKDLSISFPLIGQKEKEKKLLLQLQSMEGSQKEATQALPMHVHMPYQPRQVLYKDLAMPLTSPFSPTSQNLQPLVMTHPNHNPFRPSGILPSITHPVPPQLESQANPQNDSLPMKKDKEQVYQFPNPTIGASLRPLDMNMLTVDPDPPNPILSFLKTLTLNDFREPLVLPVIEDSDLDLFDLGLEEVFMANNEPKVEEEDDVLRPKNPPSPPPAIFPPPPFIPEYQTRLAYSPTTNSKHLFTLDNAPPSRWHDEIFSMYSWCIAEL